MASREYLVEQFKKLENEKEKRLFCMSIWAKDAWRDDREVLPEGYSDALLFKLKAAMNDVGRPDLYEQFLRAWMSAGISKTRHFSEKLKREVLGDLYE